MEKVISDIEKGEDLIRVSLSEFRGKQYIDIRIHYMAEDGEWKPTRKGITLTPELMEVVSEGITESLGELKKQPVS